ncbi:histidine phosphatase family protein [Alkalibacter saccharofermentans]|uniref:Probable phosphoglycerate mutase n=1 Tax=Alkalibacter saccharofermentans DSM 14828 TaxID=1120975 RepID=A0A1M4VE58_9FIRM|nr:histidine phosphatase family protein [Alkalibacter saccharofermentans]SHE67264.1 probable phosphoglycerate mutase [Alkalibacter saccharofermentans DSM 14828]
MEIYIVRHGTTQWNLEGRIQGCTDTDLLDSGKEEARLLEPTVSSLPIKKIYSSPLKRAYDTALILNKGLNLPLIVKKDLREIEFGEWEGLTWSQVLDKYSHLIKENDTGYVDPPAGESFYQALDRVRGVMEEIISSGENCLVVSHKATIRFILYGLIKKTPAQTGAIEIDNLSILKLSFNDKKFVGWSFT